MIHTSSLLKYFLYNSTLWHIVLSSKLIKNFEKKQQSSKHRGVGFSARERTTSVGDLLVFGSQVYSSQLLIITTSQAWRYIVRCKSETVHSSTYSITDCHNHDIWAARYSKNWTKLSKNWTNLALFKISCRIILTLPQLALKKSYLFVQFGVNLVHFL